MAKKIMKSDLDNIVEMAYKIGMLNLMIVESDLDDLSKLACELERDELATELEAFGLRVPSIIPKMADSTVIGQPYIIPKGTTLL